VLARIDDAREPDANPATTMTTTIEIDDDLAHRLEQHLEDDQTLEEFIEELVSMYETEGAFLQEGYSE